MICQKRKGLDLRRGIAVVVLLAIGWCTFGTAIAIEAFAADEISVKLNYTKKLNYGNYHTYDFKVTYGGDTRVAYCVEPALKRPGKAAYPASEYNSAVMRKLLYYSYGMPGYDSKTAGYFAALHKSKNFSGANGPYILCHRVLSYAYQKTDSLAKLSSADKKTVKSAYAEMKSWPDPPSGGSFGFDKSVVKAVYNAETGLQETPEIKLIADPDNSITVEIPEGVKMIKCFADGSTDELSSDSVKSVTIAGGDSFRFTAPGEKEGTYRSSEMKESRGIFSAYMIKRSKEQDTAFALQKKRSISFELQWSPHIEKQENEKPVLRTSAAERESGDREITAGGVIAIIDKVTYTGLTPGKEYTVTGRLIDKSTRKAIEGSEGKTPFSPTEADGTVDVKFEVDSGKFAGKSLVIFEKLYSGEELIASHEDIDDEAQTIVIKEEKATEETTEKPAEKPEASVTNADTTTEKPTRGKPITETTAATAAVTEAASAPETLPQTPAKEYESSPVTGDEIHAAVAFMIMAASLLAAGCCIVFRKSGR